MEKGKFAVIIISHGRPHLTFTEDKLRACGYTGKIVYLVDDMDEKNMEYIKKHGNENVYVFNKRFVALRSDRMINNSTYKATLFARNVAWDVAKELHLDYFCVMDDDYYYFGHRGKRGAKKSTNLDSVFEYFVDFLLATPTKCIAFSQGGDHIGGFDETVIAKRKMMNSFFCLTKRPFKFYGIMNDDVNAYLRNGSVGEIYLTYMPFQLDQIDTQQESGGLTEAYEMSGTYVKSFYSVMIAPSVVKIKLMGEKSPRLHHSISWCNTCPCIISENLKKY